MMNMLYHGTSANALPQIIEQGLLPRAKTKTKGNWGHTVTSHKDAVYLTTVYAWHFAACATDNEPGLILEIDQGKLLSWLLCPDEDCLEQITRGETCVGEQFAPLHWSMKKRTSFYRKHAQHNPQHAQTSLNYLGTAAYYGTIPWAFVTRYVTVNWDTLDKSMCLRAIDSMVSVTNFRILQDRHRAFTKWFFGDPVTPEDLLGGLTFPEQDKVIEALTVSMNNREGLQVVTPQRELLSA